MKKIIYFIVGMLLLTSCEDFLDSSNKTKKDSSNFPQTEADVSQLLTGIYAILGRPEPLGSLFFVSELMSDDRLGGGGPDDKSCKAIDQFKKSSEDMFNNPWRAMYFGVYRSNYLLANLDNVVWNSEESKNKILGETHFLRAYFYFDLARMFGEVPMVLEPEPVNIPKTPANQLYAQIASDLKNAIEMLPSVKFQDIDRAKDLGRVTKWAAEALMARVFLFYTGYYRTEALPLADGGQVTKAEVTDWIVDCVENSGHDLLPDFRNLWAYSYVQDYKYTADNNLSWAGDGSVETVFSIKYSALSNDWNSPQQKSNQICLYSGFREQNFTKTFPFGQGWGMGTVNPKIYNDWDPNDVRRGASVLDVRNTDEVADFDFGGGNQQDNTCYFQKKYIPINVWTDETKTKVYNFSHELYGMEGTDYQRDNIQDLILIRFSDVLLMAAELGAPNAQQYLDRVRSRAGLGSVPATLENIKAERRFELAFEGIRYYDLLRWHDEDQITANQTGIVTYNRRGMANAETTNIAFRPETGGFLPIPQTQIDLSGGVLTQNAGWEGSDNYLN
ncbi:RagB/SusD family nutrient uptake outer membrane protein [Barnesiella viscericola]|uniref:RagB/SusD family nutrient uptake outer membrane protein n=1 Tax=Barnesiella viscericola TaxID=397865 RepID=A0A921MR66_9BACT|nr:RagB/SusD family nutrient uptake outer membrane protein [Barnesiella viscericola]HJG88810.1 RagB/SusD family nutrient uptake outer membrane protein [Barnesiella viscericola]